MTYEESIPVAKKLAEQALSKGFDVEAFLILYLTHNFEPEDIPGTEIDDNIQEMYNLFLLYVKNRDLDVLERFLDINYRMIDELFHSTDNTREKNILYNYINKIESLRDS